MRVSVYVQCFSCIALLLFPTAHELVKSSFRTSLLTMYAIGFSFFFAHHTGSYSLQSILVAHCFVDILLLSAFSLMCFRPSLQSRKHYVILIGGIPFAIWTLVQAAGRHTACYDSLLSKTISVDSHTFQLYKSFWAISAIVYTLSLPLLFLISFPRLVARLQPGAGWLAVLSWLLATVSTVAVSEITMATVVFKSSDNQLASLQSSEWTFGQVFAVVMLFFVVWDIALYPLECSNESEGSRLQHWWNTKFKPSHPRLVKFFGISKFFSISLLNDFSRSDGS